MSKTSTYTSHTGVEVTATEVEFCGCTNTQLERGETCGQDNCPTKDYTPEQRQACREEFGGEDGCY